MHESSLGVHQIELMVESSPSLEGFHISSGISYIHLGDCSCIREHADGSRDFGEIASRHHGGRLIVDADLIRNKVIIDKSFKFLGCLATLRIRKKLLVETSKNLS